jgi:hypothetical protein
MLKSVLAYIQVNFSFLSQSATYNRVGKDYKFVVKNNENESASFKVK